MVRFFSFIIGILNVGIIAWSVINEHPLYYTNIGNTGQISLYLVWNFFSLLPVLFLLGDADAIGSGAGDFASISIWTFLGLLGGSILYVLLADYPYVTKEFGIATGVVLGITTITTLMICTFCYDKRPARS